MSGEKAAGVDTVTVFDARDVEHAGEPLDTLAIKTSANFQSEPPALRQVLLRHVAGLETSDDAAGFVDDLFEDLIDIVRGRFAPELTRFEAELILAELRTRQTEHLTGLVKTFVRRAVEGIVDDLEEELHG